MDLHPHRNIRLLFKFFFSFFSRFGKRGFLITFASLLLGHFITTAVILGHYNLDPLLMGGGENP